MVLGFFVQEPGGFVRLLLSSLLINEQVPDLRFFFLMELEMEFC